MQSNRQRNGGVTTTLFALEMSLPPRRGSSAPRPVASGFGPRRSPSYLFRRGAVCCVEFF